MAGDFVIFVSIGEWGPSCSIGFFDEGALSSHLILIGISLNGECSFTVESGVEVVVMVAVMEGLKIGTNADFTTSICSSSESSDDECEEWSLVELNSIEELILWFGVDWLFEGGLDVEFLDDAGDNRAPFDCSPMEVPPMGWGAVLRAP